MTTLWHDTLAPDGALGYGGTQQRIGTDFHVSSNLNCNRVTWYQHATGDPDFSEFALFNRDTGARLIHLDVPAGSYTAGWNHLDFADGFLCIPGVLYQMTGVTAHSTTYHYISTANSTYADLTHFSDMAGKFADSAYTSGYGAGSGSSGVGGWALGPSDGGTGFAGDGGTGGTTGVGDPVVGGDLSAWLSSDGATQQHETDGLPWQTYTLATGASGFAAIKGVVDTIATSVGSGLRTAVTTLTTNLATANAALVHAAATWSDALATALQNMSDDFASFGASKPAQGGGDFGTGTFPSNVGTLVWTMLDETDFSGSIAWPQPADVYVLSITTRPAGLPLNLTDGVHTIYRCGWWTPLNGSFARQRSYIDFEDSHLAIGAERMPGILVSLLPGGEGHIQAWALT